MNTFHDKLPNPVHMVGKYQVVKTPTPLVARKLDGFPVHVWKDKTLKWLVPVSKTGVYELGIYMRLMRGLKDVIPNHDERRDWIVNNMIWSFTPTQACEYLVRRNYLGKVWNTIRGFDNLAGNVQTRDFLSARLNSKGEVMVKQDEGNRGTYVKFDCIVGNPPYQQTVAAGKTSSSALYPAFIIKAMECKPQYLSMVIPSKWMVNAGKGTQVLLEKMISSKKLTKIVSVENSKDWFDGIELIGGAMYFLYDDSASSSITDINGIAIDLAGEDIIISDTVGLKIKNKVLAKSSSTFDTTMYGQNPYGINTNHSEWSDTEIDSYVCHRSGEGGGGSATRFIRKSIVNKNAHSADKWKLCTPKAYGAEPRSTGSPFILEPNHICTQAYNVIGVFSSEDEAINAMKYITTHFAQFMVALRKYTQNMPKSVYKWLPTLDFTISYTDADLYTMFDLSSEEITHIENTTKDFPIFRASKRGKKKP